ncbi:tRNA1Val (adenine37-N6)-methyltransferase [Saccharicrinis carchari]|uniref:tRNA1(Val) (adenine(37)-N6)-methyltransferase n=1 Tax=Saccharicrinis carchari TaxID=1168039 RepID=A0A521DC65_SACCC|nr:methyltransferase [Saccharicrinis carchari]SMO69172.1 tRNA1Val (adenine37-N6)-methyltransferase [Saccharicrinis carchari]
MANKVFNFKQFAVRQEKAAMKIGTDGVLLGAWASVNKVQSVLDIGTGTGLIALMLAQRTTDALIHAVELDHAAQSEAAFNFKASPWNNRLNAIHADFKTCHWTSSYDLIVSNPPFFKHSLKNPCDKKSIARHTDSLSYDQLIRGAVKLLSNTGRFCVVLPASERNNFKKIAAQDQLYLNKVLYIKPTPSKPPKRVLMEFSFENKLGIENEMIIEEFGRHGYSDDYKQLTKDFYLGF